MPLIPRLGNLPKAVANTTTQTLLTAGTTIICTNKLQDNRNAYNTATGIFTVPEDGDYVVELEFLQTAATAATSGIEAEAFRNSTVFSIVDTRKFTQSGANRKVAMGKATMSGCVVGDALKIVVYDADNTVALSQARISFRKVA